MHVLVLLPFCFFALPLAWWTLDWAKVWGKSANTRGSRVVPWAVTVPYRNILVPPVHPISLLVCAFVSAAPPMTPCHDLFCCQEFLMTLFAV